MTFPLLSDLRKRYPTNPLLFIGEEAFYRELRTLIPGVEFLPPSRLKRAPREKYELLVNLDSRPEAARFAALADANLKLGPLLDAAGTMRVDGYWQLYRASLTQNNRHNLFHWGDLNRLDLEWPLEALPQPPPRHPAGRRVALFIGASEASKRPHIPFWAALARLLLAQGYQPVILGGPGEKSAGEEIARRSGLVNANFAGKTSLAQLSAILQTLRLFITADTGPMHLADWLGAPVFNLSMGNVHAQETGPMRPGQLVMRASMSCSGCWQCSRGKLYCHGAFNPALVSRIAHAYMENELSSPHAAAKGVELFLTGRDDMGLYSLTPLFPSKRHMIREALDRFWQSAFLFIDQRLDFARLRQEAERLSALSPRLSENIHKHINSLLSLLISCARGKKAPGNDFWKNFPRHSSLFAGFIEMRLQNDSFSQTAVKQALDLSAQIGELFSSSH